MHWAFLTCVKVSPHECVLVVSARKQNPTRFSFSFFSFKFWLLHFFGSGLTTCLLMQKHARDPKIQNIIIMRHAFFVRLLRCISKKYENGISFSLVLTSDKPMKWIHLEADKCRQFDLARGYGKSVVDQNRRCDSVTIERQVKESLGASESRLGPTWHASAWLGPARRSAPVRTANQAFAKLFT